MILVYKLVFVSFTILFKCYLSIIIFIINTVQQYVRKNNQPQSSLLIQLQLIWKKINKIYII